MGLFLVFFNQLFDHRNGKIIIFPKRLDGADLLHMNVIIIRAVFSGFARFLQNAFPYIVMDSFLGNPGLLDQLSDLHEKYFLVYRLEYRSTLDGQMIIIILT